MGIVRLKRKAETRALLLDAGLRVFAERGLEFGSLDEVAQSAGFTKGDLPAVPLQGRVPPCPVRAIRCRGARGRGGAAGPVVRPPHYPVRFPGDARPTAAAPLRGCARGSTDRGNGRG